MSKKFDECIIHIGTEKTGTTTLQNFFRTNELNLAKMGILYSKTLGDKPSHSMLPAYAQNNQKLGGQRMNLGLTNEKQITNFRNELRKKFRQEVENQNSSKLLHSSEHLHSAITNVDEVKRLKNFLDEFVERYKIVVYLRPQHDMAISHFSTRIRTGETEEIILPRIDENNSYFNYEKLLNRWEEVFGFENILTRIFSREEFLKGDLKKDFIKILGLDWNNFEDVPNINESLNSDAQRFLLEINKFIPHKVDGKHNPILGNMVNLVAQNRAGQGLLPTCDQAQDFFRMFTKSNDEVKKKWFPDRKELFNVDFSKYPKNFQTETDLSFAFEIFADLWSAKMQNVFSDRKRLDKVKIRNKELRELLENIKPNNFQNFFSNLIHGKFRK